ncbi:VOC family protein [Nakamurella lactea]|uniref:VOC family protein n=1 Tax=Nakamurella lactea TaxID=459515 RepID=UPI0003FB342D|nr:VOC family protein [Nakamurella lactea]
MSLRWYTVVVDCRDVAAQARWWAQVLDWKMIYEADDEAVIVPKHATADKPSAQDWTTVPPGLVFVPVAEGKTVKNRLHIDLAPHLTDDRDAEIQRLLDLGATRADVGQDREKVTWEVLADPEGNEFCVLSAREL